MKWELSIPNMELVEELKFECGITETQAKLLVNRGIKTCEDANLYLYGDIRDFYNPKSLAGINKALEILIDAYNKKRKIFVFGDYDADGVTASIVTCKALRNIGIECEYYIPHRSKEGYGLSKLGIDIAKNKGYNIIYTVDNGIAAIDEVSYAKELGFEVIITDHHDIPNTLPLADTLINPKLPYCKYPNKKLCGCSVTWKVLYALYKELDKDLEYMNNLLIYVAIATIGDMMDLDGENRLIVKEGLKRINQDKNISCTMIKKIFKLEEVYSSDIAFIYVPLINAAGRISDTYKVAEFLYGKNIDGLINILKIFDKIMNRKDIATSVKEEIIEINKTKHYILDVEKELIYKELSDLNKKELETLSLEEIYKQIIKEYDNTIKELELMANDLYETNEKRKEMTIEYYNECIELIKKNKLNDYNIIVVIHENIPEGLVGLVAGKIKEKYQKPTFVLTYGKEYIKGSGRGVEGHPLSLFEGINLTKDLWDKGGGHPMAAGLSFKKDISLVNEFRDRLDKYIDELFKMNKFEPKIMIDGIVNVPTEQLCREIKILEPTGKNNSPALFATDCLDLKEVRAVGDGTHLRVVLTNDITGIGFSLMEKFKELSSPNSLKFLYTPDINIYTYINNYTNKEVTKKTVQMLIKDINKKTEKVTQNKMLLISSIKQKINKRH